MTLTHGFWIGKYLVTQGEYEAVVGNNPSWFKGDVKITLGRALTLISVLTSPVRWNR